MAGRILWTCCKKCGHAMTPSNCYWEYSTLYPYKRCKRCRSDEGRAKYQRNKTKREWLAANNRPTRSRQATGAERFFVWTGAATQKDFSHG